MTMLNLDELRFSSEKLNVSSLNNQNKALTMNNLVYELFKELIGFFKHNNFKNNDVFVATNKHFQKDKKSNTLFYFKLHLSMKQVSALIIKDGEKDRYISFEKDNETFYLNKKINKDVLQAKHYILYLSKMFEIIGNDKAKIDLKKQ